MHSNSLLKIELQFPLTTFNASPDAMDIYIYVSIYPGGSIYYILYIYISPSPWSGENERNEENRRELWVFGYRHVSVDWKNIHEH